MNPVPDLNDAGTRNGCQKIKVDLWCRFLERVHGCYSLAQRK